MQEATRTRTVASVQNDFIFKAATVTSCLLPANHSVRCTNLSLFYRYGDSQDFCRPFLRQLWQAIISWKGSGTPAQSALLERRKVPHPGASIETQKESGETPAACPILAGKLISIPQLLHYAGCTAAARVLLQNVAQVLRIGFGFLRAYTQHSPASGLQMLGCAGSY